jgi:hypothetical protein
MTDPIRSNLNAIKTVLDNTFGAEVTSLSGPAVIVRVRDWSKAASTEIEQIAIGYSSDGELLFFAELGIRPNKIPTESLVTAIFEANNEGVDYGCFKVSLEHNHIRFTTGLSGATQAIIPAVVLADTLTYLMNMADAGHNYLVKRLGLTRSVGKNPMGPAAERPLRTKSHVATKSVTTRKSVKPKKEARSTKQTKAWLFCLAELPGLRKKHAKRLAAVSEAVLSTPLLLISEPDGSDPRLAAAVAELEELHSRLTEAERKVVGKMLKAVEDAMDDCDAWYEAGVGSAWSGDVAIFETSSLEVASERLEMLGVQIERTDSVRHFSKPALDWMFTRARETS